MTMSSIENTSRDNAHVKFDTRPIWRTFWVLLVITQFEITLATVHMKLVEHGHEFPPKMVLNGVYLILTCAKAFYIIAEFMHLRHEIKNLIMTIAVPACLFIWFLLAFVLDGNSYRNLRNRYDQYHAEEGQRKVAPAGGERGPIGHENGPAVKPGEKQ